MRDFISKMTLIQKGIALLVVLLVIYTDVAYQEGDYKLAFLSLGSTLLTAVGLSLTFGKKEKR